MIETQLDQATSFKRRGRKTLAEITDPVSGPLKDFRSFYKQALRTDVFFLDKIVQYLLRQKGKEIRPTLVFMSARLFGEVSDRSYVAATMIELLHTATLIHDDVVDEADTRRGFLSINKIWRNKAGVLLGDFLLSKGLLIALDNDEFKLLKVLSKAVKSMSEGELRQFKAASLFNMTEEYYFKVISEKTASLIAACCECGAISTSDDPEIHQKMHDIGMCVGTAFQIRDDLFDYGIDDVGKPRRNDIKERKVTLPLIKALENASFVERTRIRYLMRKRKKKDKEIEDIVTFVHEKGGIGYARSIMEEYAENAIEKLSTLPPSEDRKAFKDLIQFIVKRKR
ncbi:polyprenyl synthetase family protein [Aliifodinibius sp. S!AR15-10]|uniref:polyprenyl synthetase family protein n=1 Tax=Aliifodinibius sp. S!AR15-10 TaxID=2950437 RepID=UPI0028638A83|nr:polyprenyl synthetase family protein [Aliifodinibius sp. S!AR15-10]MDR8390209.1 polyprenyl synthetase family protein [Aliifodinibius sp. S!AR15-10]